MLSRPLFPPLLLYASTHYTLFIGGYIALNLKQGLAPSSLLSSICGVVSAAQLRHFAAPLHLSLSLCLYVGMHKVFLAPVVRRT